MTKRWFTAILCALTVLAGSVAAKGGAEGFERGNTFYESGNYDSAITLYQAVIDSGVESASLYFNLGNAYFKQGDLGNAVVNYLRAKRLAPADQDIENNLEFARQFSQVQMEGVELSPVDTFLKSLVGEYRLSTLAWIASACFVLFMIALILRFGLGYNLLPVRSLAWVALVLCLVTSSLTTYKYRAEFVTRRGVIVAEESRVLSGPSETADEEFHGSPGLIVEVVGESGDYLNVLFENKRRGWIRQQAVTLL